MKVRYSAIAATMILILSGCGGGEAPSAADSEEGAEPVPAPTEELAQGSVNFSVDGNEKSFDFLPASASTYTPMASSIRAHSEAESTESLAIHVMAIDLKKMTYPTELPLPRDPSKPMDPMMAMASVGFGYINAEGVEWAGPGKIQIESFGNDGVIRGTFDQVSLPHTDKEQPDIALTNGSFSAQIVSPW